MVHVVSRGDVGAYASAFVPSSVLAATCHMLSGIHVQPSIHDVATTQTMSITRFLPISHASG